MTHLVQVPLQHTTFHPQYRGDVYTVLAESVEGFNGVICESLDEDPGELDNIDDPLNDILCHTGTYKQQVSIVYLNI